MTAIFLAGLATGLTLSSVLFLLLLKLRPRYVAPTKRDLPEAVRKSARKPCRACYGGDLPCVCQHEPDFWSIAEAQKASVAAQESEAQPMYMYGIGIEDFER